MRIDRDKAFIEIAKIMAQRGTCSRAQVGAVIVQDRRIISTGYNGAPAGMDHCEHNTGAEAPEAGGPLDIGCKVAVHAELNAIAYAARAGVATEGATMYCTHAPCLPCGQAIIQAGIASVVYEKEYRILDGLDLIIEKLDDQVLHWLPEEGIMPYSHYWNEGL